MCRDCHLIDIGVKMETDRVFTVIGTIDTERRRNWEIQRSGRAALQSSLAQKHSLTRLLKGWLCAFLDRPDSASNSTTLHGQCAKKV